jgi:hypothetical protein
VGFSEVRHFPVAEAEAADADGFPISVMLFASSDETVLATLDVLRVDGGPIQRLPSPEDLNVKRTSSWSGAAA